MRHGGKCRNLAHRFLLMRITIPGNPARVPLITRSSARRASREQATQLLIG